MSVRFVHAADIHLGSPLRTVGAQSTHLADRLADATYTAFERIVDLARTNQVLLLTCHPEIVRLVDEVADVGGYWCLDDGRFNGPRDDPTEACAFLNAE